MCVLSIVLFFALYYKYNSQYLVKIADSKFYCRILNYLKVIKDNTKCTFQERCAPNITSMDSRGAMEAWHILWDNETCIEVGIFNNRKVYQSPRMGFYIYYSESDTNSAHWTVNNTLILSGTR